MANTVKPEQQYGRVAAVHPSMEEQLRGFLTLKNNLQHENFFLLAPVGAVLLYPCRVQ